MTTLIKALRYEIADCIEKKYKNVSKTFAARMLDFGNGIDMDEFAKKVKLYLYTVS